MVRSLFYVLILLLLYFIIQFIFFPTTPNRLLAKQICLAPSGCKIEMDTGFCPKCIEVKEEPPIIKEEKVMVEKKLVVKVSDPPLYPRVNESLRNKVKTNRKPNKRNWVGTLFECIVGCKEGVKYWDEGGNEFDKNLNLISTN